MQTCTVEVLLGGNVKNTAILQNVTPAEVQILRQLHGLNSVQFRGERDEAKHRHSEEVERLRDKYRTSDPTIMGAKIPVFDRVFPGVSPKLPIRFSEINFGEQELEVRVLPDKPGFHGDAKNPEPPGDPDDWDDNESPAEEPAAPVRRGRGRPPKSVATEETAATE